MLCSVVWSILPSCTLWKRAPTSALVAEARMECMMLLCTWTAPLMGGVLLEFDRKKYLPAHERAFVSDKYDASEWI